MMTCDRPTSITLAGEARLALVSVPLLVTALGTPHLPTTGSSFVSVTVLGLLKGKYYVYCLVPLKISPLTSVPPSLRTRI